MAEINLADQLVYAVIGNIPPDYHSSDLRNYFSQFIEGKGFHCFHFRHRPELRKDKDPDQHLPSFQTATTTTNQTSGNVSMFDTTTLSQEKEKKKKTTSCCVVRLRDSKCKELINMYNMKHWLDKNGDSIACVCVISRVKVQRPSPFDSVREENTTEHDRVTEEGSAVTNYKTRQEQRLIPEEREDFTAEDLNKLKELHPPDVMPNGNVGTPTLVFLEFIRQCLLPPIVIKKLGLSFPKTRTNKTYGNVPFDYGGHRKVRSGVSSEDNLLVKSADGKELLPQGDIPECSTHSSPNPKHSTENSMRQKWRKLSKAEKARRKELMSERIEEKMIAEKDESGEDNDSCEEWERHEANYDDVTSQERNKERLFEESIELKWEKGGSGLVFYTDAQFWDEKEGDFDEKTTDDYDVDMSIYYEPGAGDMDAKECVQIRQEKRRRDGVENTDFQTIGIGKFEKHTKGFGRRILTRQGWKDGQGLGSTITGISEALENDGQNPKDRKGFGYRGEKLIQYTGTKRRAHKDVIISTIYDDPKETDPVEPLLRRHEPYGLSYRVPVKFTKASNSDFKTC